jgi:hypothetical protein
LVTLFQINTVVQNTKWENQRTNSDKRNWSKKNRENNVKMACICSKDRESHWYKSGEWNSARKLRTKIQKCHWKTIINGIWNQTSERRNVLTPKFKDIMTNDLRTGLRLALHLWRHFCYFEVTNKKNSEDENDINSFENLTVLTINVIPILIKQTINQFNISTNSSETWSKSQIIFSLTQEMDA